jgi:hypothetical protein
MWAQLQGNLFGQVRRCQQSRTPIAFLRAAGAGLACRRIAKAKFAIPCDCDKRSNKFLARVAPANERLIQPRTRGKFSLRLSDPRFSSDAQRD